MATPPEFFAQRFPRAATQTGEWAPVYLEPLPGSGERLTVAVASRIDTGQFRVIRTLDGKRAHCMYGAHAASVNGLVDLLVDSLKAHLETMRPLQEWVPPFRDGAFLGPISVGHGDTVDEIARAGAMLAASLSVWNNFTDSLPDAERGEDDGDEWATQIRERTVVLRHNFANRFMKKIELRRGAPATKIGYFGDRLAAQFGRLIPGRGLTNSRNRAKAYVTDLQILRDMDRDIFIKRPFYELMLWVPPADSPAYSADQREEARGAFAELEAFGDKHELRVEALSDSTAAAKRILQVEEAA